MSYFSMPHAVRVDPNLSSHFMHRFGGVPIHKIMNPEYRNLRLHCLYILDMNDPCLPNITSTGKFLPLYYPLFNNACEFAYQIINDEEIVIHHLGQEEAELDFPYENYPQVLPVNHVALKALSYEEQKTLVYAFTANEYLGEEYISEADQEFLSTSGYPFTQIGGIQRMMQGVPENVCPNKHCEYNEYSNMQNVFAVVWNDPIPDFKIWGEYGDYVQLIFQICPKCETIYVSNRCD